MKCGVCILCTPLIKVTVTFTGSSPQSELSPLRLVWIVVPLILRQCRERMSFFFFFFSSHAADTGTVARGTGVQHRCAGPLRQTAFTRRSPSRRLLFWLTFPPLAYSVSRLRGEMSEHICESAISLRIPSPHRGPSCAWWPEESLTGKWAKPSVGSPNALPISHPIGIYKNCCKYIKKHTNCH